MLLAVCWALLSVLLWQGEAQAAVSATPNTWNVVGLDSNNVNIGPNHFPVGAKVCGGTPGAADTATFVWDTSTGSDNGTYIHLRPGSANPVSFTYDGSGCANAYFEAEIKRDSNAYDKYRPYHITTSVGSTPTPRQIYVEHLISQSRNGINFIKLNGTTVASGGAMSLIVGNTYTIELNAFTATQGYEQLDAFINFPNTIFQVQGVSATYSSDNSPYVPNPNPSLYADSCQWDNDPASPYYNSCVGGDYKAGGTVDLTYTVKIINGGGTSQVLNTLINDFSGSSYHYNADFSSNFVVANVIDPNTITISKSFGPNPTNAGGVSTLTFNLTNPNPGAVSGISFSDPLPTSPGAMVVASPPNASSTGCGTPTFSPTAGNASLSASGITIAANSSCSMQVAVSVPTAGTYSNTTNHLFVGSADTGNSANATLTANNMPAPPAPTCGLALASWTMDPSQGTTVPPAPFSKASDVSTAAATYSGTGTSSIITSNGNPVNSWGATGGWAATATGYPNAGVAPYMEFSVDSSKYTGVGITFSFFMDGNWANSANNAIYVYSSANGGAFTNIYSATSVTKNNWYTVAVAAAATGSSTTTFRINAVGLQQQTAALELDNVSLTGCGVPPPPTITKSFSPATVAVNGTSTLTFTITNPATGAVSGIAFSDTLPLNKLQGTVAVTSGSAVVTGTGTAFSSQLAAGGIISINSVNYTILSIQSATQLTLSTNYSGSTVSGLFAYAGLTVSSAATTTCGGTVTGAVGSGAVTLANSASLAAGGTCTVTATVKDSIAGPITNVSGFVSATQSGANTGTTGVATASMTAILPPGISERFSPNPILAGQTSTLTFAISNPNQNVSLSGVTFTNPLPTSPGNMVVASPATFSTSGCGTPTFAPVAGANTFTFSNGTIAGGAICYVTVLVTAPTPATGTYTDNSGIVSATTVGNGNSASATLTVSAPHPEITILKQVAGTNTAGTAWEPYLAVAAGGDVYYQYLVENDGDVALSSVSVTDPSAVMSNCSWKDGDGGTLTAPFTLPAPISTNNKNLAICTLGPISALSGSHTSTATVTGTYSGTPYSDNDSVTYATTGLTIAKTSTATAFGAAGSIVNYSYLITNSGAAALVGPFTVTDDKASVSCPAVSTVGDLDGSFDPGESMTCTAAYTVKAADVAAKTLTNTAFASSGTDGSIPGVSTSTVSLTLPLAADLTVLKTNNVAGSATVGSSFVWTLTVSNAVSAGTASIASGQTLLTDDMPSSNVNYVYGGVTKAGITGTVNCSLSSATVTCTTGSALTIPAALTGTVTVTNASATVTGSGTAFSSQLTAGSVLNISGTPYTVLSILNDGQLTLTTPYAGSNASGISIPASFSVTVTATPTATGSLANPRGGGSCVVDAGHVIPEIDYGNNSCSNTVTVNPIGLIISKSFQTISDPVHGTVNPKPIPGAVVQYTVQVSNPSSVALDNNSLVITDAVPANTVMCVSTPCGNPPIVFSCGSSPNCGLGYVYGASGTYTSQPGGTSSFTYSPLQPDSNGYDASVTGFRVNPTGSFNGASGGNNSTMSIVFKVMVK